MGLLDSFKSLFTKKKGGGKKAGGKKPVGKKPVGKKPVVEKKVTPKKKKLPRIVVEKRFDLLGRTGQGSMSKVWRARDRQTGRTVCVKVLDKAKTDKFDARFPGLIKPSEGEILQLLQHENIVKTYEHGLTNKKEQYIIMELVEGVGLNFVIETKSKQLEGNRISYLDQLANALGFMHDKGFLHRDICPRNIMVNTEGVVKLIDFGLGIPNTPDFGKPGNRTGTPNYLAPEIIKRTTTDHRADLFALGVTAYELFTNELPWEKGDSMQTLMSHVNTPGRDPTEYRPDLDKATTAFLVKAIKRDPDERFQSAALFREALKKLPKA